MGSSLYRRHCHVELNGSFSFELNGSSSFELNGSSSFELNGSSSFDIHRLWKAREHVMHSSYIQQWRIQQVKKGGSFTKALEERVEN